MSGVNMQDEAPLKPSHFNPISPTNKKRDLKPLMINTNAHPPKNFFTLALGGLIKKSSVNST